MKILSTEATDAIRTPHHLDQRDSRQYAPLIPEAATELRRTETAPVIGALALANELPSTNKGKDPLDAWRATYRRPPPLDAYKAPVYIVRGPNDYSMPVRG